MVRPNDSNSSFDIDEKSGLGGLTGSSTDAGAVSTTSPSKAEIKRAFAKSLKGKKMNKKILSEFIELVA